MPVTPPLKQVQEGRTCPHTCKRKQWSRVGTGNQCACSIPGESRVSGETGQGRGAWVHHPSLIHTVDGYRISKELSLGLHVPHAAQGSRGQSPECEPLRAPATEGQTM